jgi:NAD(P) transhydrogenase subunit alpha
MVQGMRAGSVVVDLAAESGGNVEGVAPGQDIAVPTADGAGHVTLVGLKDAASAMASDASRLYAKNVANLLALMVRDGTMAPDFDDEVVAGACLTHDGEVRHQPTAALLAARTRTRQEGVL